MRMKKGKLKSNSMNYPWISTTWNIKYKNFTSKRKKMVWPSEGYCLKVKNYQNQLVFKLVLTNNLLSKLNGRR